MNDKNTEETTSCCGQSSGAASGCCGPAIGSANRTKTLVFLLVMGAAGAVLAHALVNKSDVQTDEARQPFGSIASQGKTDAPSSADTAANPATPGKAAPASCGLTLDSLASLEQKAADKDAVFILLPGEDRERAQSVSDLIESAVEKIRSKGRRVAAFTLEQNSDDHAGLVEGFSVASFPCVIAIGRRGFGSIVVSGQVTEAKLLRAFVVASTPASSCGTGESSGCCPLKRP